MCQNQKFVMYSFGYWKIDNKKFRHKHVVCVYKLL